MPIKFNGSIFTVAPDETLVDKKEVGLDADFRLWGANFGSKIQEYPTVACIIAVILN